jgi:hypothetical protein
MWNVQYGISTVIVIYLLNAMGLTPGGNSTVHIYIQQQNETEYPERNIHNNNNIQSDQKVPVHLMITVQKTRKNILNITEYIRNKDRAIPNTVSENTVWRVNKCLQTGGGHFEHYL